MPSIAPNHAGPAPMEARKAGRTAVAVSWLQSLKRLVRPTPSTVRFSQDLLSVFSVMGHTAIERAFTLAGCGKRESVRRRLGRGQSKDWPVQVLEKELLDRYGLSLGEMEFRAQPCEGIGIQTNRRRIAPIDECIPAIAAFFDCRVWAERAEAAPLRYIFFGLRGDVTAARYLYEMVERAFETETDGFRASDIYFQMVGERRSATNSFQTGLARGISGKLHAMRAAREAVIRSASGRDLVPAKAAIVDEEMEKLGLSLSSRALGRGKRVLTDAFAAGEAAGQRFEFAPAITEVA